MRVQGSGFRFESQGCRTSGLRSRVHDLVARVVSGRADEGTWRVYTELAEGGGFMVQRLGFWVRG